VKPTGPIPPYFEAAADGQLLIGGIPAEELVADAGGTPLFVYDNNIVGAQIAALKAAMPDGLAIYYSVSANPYEPLLNFLGRYVDGFRVVSRGELDHLKRAGLAGIGMTFAGPGKSDDELEKGIAAGATISVESEGEAARAIRAGERVGVKPRLAVRVNPPFSIDKHGLTMGARPTPFGVDSERVPALVQGLLQAGADWRGLHIFAAAQCLDCDALVEAHRAIIVCAGTSAGRSTCRSPS
jgi:diaminopimelate decarboxylase